MQPYFRTLEYKYVTGAYLLLAAVYIAGLFVPLMDNDSGDYALIAMNMAQDNDFINIMRKGEDYLDKPHLLFWLTGLSFKIFGINTVAYKLPSVLFSVLAIYSTTRLGSLLFDNKTGILSGLVLGFAQAFIIQNYDVRTDAILTGATIFGIWQYFEFATNRRYLHIILGSLGIALAVGTKGMIAVIVAGCTVFLHLLYHRRLKEILGWPWLSSILWFFIFLSPFLYCYYLQFDAQPNKITNGVKGMSGIKFLLWTQSFERLSGQRNMVNRPDYFFFFHTFLWAFVPWSLLAYYEMFRDWILLARRKFRVEKRIEFALSGTVLLVMVLMSTSKFKLPHYLNILFPLIAIITGKAIMRLIDRRQELPAWVRIVFYVICALFIVLAILLLGWAFPLDNYFKIVLAVLCLGVLLYLYFKLPSAPLRPFFLVMFTAGVVNFFLNVHFFPSILKYQGSINLSAYVNRSDIPKTDIVSYVGTRYFAFDIYTKTEIPEPKLKDIQIKAATGQPFYIMTDKWGLPELDSVAINKRIIHQVPQFHVSMLTGKFINPKTRKESLDSLTLLKVN
jgi:4-amino-4-deoxy-L-arabinose transferase-like glycosyltransferase